MPCEDIIGILFYYVGGGVGELRDGAEAVGGWLYEWSVPK